MEQVPNVNNDIKKLTDNKSFFSGDLTKSQSIILRRLLIMHKRYEELFPTVARLASMCRVSVSTVERAIRKFIELGIITKQWRAFQSNIYQFTEYFMQEENQKKLWLYFNMMVVFDVNSLTSKPAASANEGLLYYKEELLIANAASALNKTALKKQQQACLYLPDRTWYYKDMINETGPANPKRTKEEFQALISEKGSTMQAFTQEQLEQLGQYPQESISYAHKKLTKDMAAGKAISNPFAYMMGICKSHAQENKKNPETGSQQAKYQQERQAASYRRTTDNWKPGQQVVTEPHLRQPIFKTVETNFEFARNVEYLLHTTENHPYAYQVANPMWSVLSDEEKKSIMEIHQGCTCRSGTSMEDRPESPIKVFASEW